VLVTLFSSIGSLFIDFLFVDILSAPTAGTVSSSPSSTTQQQPSTDVVAITPTLGSLHEDGIPVSGSKKRAKKTLLYEDEIRVVPHEFQEAHNAALSTAAELLEGTQETVKRSVESRKSVRLTRIQSQRQFGSSQQQQQPQLQLQSQQNNAKEVLGSEELLSSLLMDIKEERGKIKKEVDREAFDSLWG
jgi:hypothetical protein